MLTLILVVLVAVVVYGAGPNLDGQPAKDLYNLVIDKLRIK